MRLYSVLMYIPIHRILWSLCKSLSQVGYTWKIVMIGCFIFIQQWNITLLVSLSLFDSQLSLIQGIDSTLLIINYYLIILEVFSEFSDLNMPFILLCLRCWVLQTWSDVLWWTPVPILLLINSSYLQFCQNWC